jgi:alanine racemase
VPRPILATFDLAALAANLKLLKERAKTAKVWAVLKANAYGHGLVRAARTLKLADGFAVLDLNDAVRLRDAGVRRPILLLEGVFEARDLPTVDDYKLHIVVHASDQIDMIERTPLRAPLEVYLKMNTGMNRLGFAPVRFGDAYRRLTARGRGGSVSFMTHFADADGPRGVTEQLERFEMGLHGLEGERSVANSAATLVYPQSHFDWVRPGIALYGCSPFADQSAESLGLAPVMTLTTRIIGIQELKPGDRVGYAGTFQAERDMRIGVIACGYADGYPRHAPNGTPVLVGERRTTIAGRVSMDLITIDVTRIPEARIGSEVTLWGRGLSADEVAAHAGTVSYELLNALAQRVPVTETE